MPTITTKAGVEIFYKAGGDTKGQTILFSHGWPLSGDAWTGQLVYFGNLGYRVIAHDRRGHGHSTATWDGNTMDAYADDLAELIEQLDLTGIVLVGHSTGGGEVTRYLGRHGTARVSKVVLVSAVPPLMVKTEANPGGLPIEVFDGIRKGTYDNRSQFYLDLTMPFYSYNREGATVSEGMRQYFWLMGMQGALKPQLDSIKEFSESDFHADLPKIDVPTLVIHGDDDQIVPIDISGRLTARLIPNATLKVYPGGCHGLAQVEQDQFNADVLAFIQS